MHSVCSLIHISRAKEKKLITKANTKWDKCDCHELLNANIIRLEHRCALVTRDNIVCYCEATAHTYANVPYISLGVTCSNSYSVQQGCRSRKSTNIRPLSYPNIFHWIRSAARSCDCADEWLWQSVSVCVWVCFFFFFIPLKSYIWEG